MKIPAIHYKQFVDYFFGTFKYNFLNQNEFRTIFQVDKSF